jgi:hypothetical protein
MKRTCVRPLIPASSPSPIDVAATSLGPTAGPIGSAWVPVPDGPTCVSSPPPVEPPPGGTG